MPYIARKRRRELVVGQDLPATSGELNYTLTRECVNYVLAHGLEYRTINDVVGALESAKAEFQRRVVGPYEDLKRDINGDVYPIQLVGDE